MALSGISIINDLFFSLVPRVLSLRYRDARTVAVGQAGARRCPVPEGVCTLRPRAEDWVVVPWSHWGVTWHLRHHRAVYPLAMFKGQW